MIRIGITGPTGAGKTTALDALADLGAAVIDADAVYHRLLETSAPLRQALTERFGPDILDAAGQVNRKALGAIVFADPAALADLNAITHRFVGAEIARLEEEARQQGAPGVAIDAIALIESGMADSCGAVVAVLAPAEVRIKRIMAREGIPEAYARSRVAAQKDDAFFRSHCPYVLENNSGDSPQAFQRRAEALFRRILAGESPPHGGRCPSGHTGADEGDGGIDKSAGA